MLTLNLADLRRALIALEPLTRPKKKMPPILSCVHFRAAPGGASVFAHDLDFRLTLSLPGDGAGIEASVPLRPLLALVRRLGAGLVRLSRDEARLRLDFDAGSVRFLLADASAAAELPDFAFEPARRHDLPLAVMRDVVAGALTEAPRYYLNGLLISGADAAPQVAATDGHRLYLAHAASGPVDPQKQGVIVPRRAVALARRAWPDRAVLAFSAGAGRFALVGDGIELRGKLIDGALVDYASVLRDVVSMQGGPEPRSGCPDVSARWSVEAGAARAVLRCVPPLGDRRGIAIVIDAAGGRVAHEGDDGDTILTLPGAFSGAAEVWVWVEYLAEALRFLDGPVVVEVRSGPHPIVSRGAGRLAVVMPMRGGRDRALDAARAGSWS